MVVGQILSNKKLRELAGDSKEKDRYIMAQLGIRTLNDVRGVFSTSVKIRVLGIPLVESQTSFEIGSLDRASKILGNLDPKFITEMNLAALIFSDWDDPVSKAKKVHYQLKKLYSSERESFLAEFGVKLPYIEFLRQEATGRKLNCLKAREKYKNFEVSREDIQRNVSLSDLNYESCVLLAGYWGRGILSLKNRYTIQLSGGKNDFDFYENWVKNAIWRVHNLEVEIKSVPIKGYEAETPRISIYSRAIATWLSRDLDFPTPKVNINLPNIKWSEERKQGFFDGIIAFMGGSLGRSKDLALHDHDLCFIENLSNLSKELGYQPKIIPEEGFEEKSHSYRLYFSPKEVRRMNLINPKHQSN